MSGAPFWVVIAACGVGTQLIRVVPMLAHGRIATPPALERALRHAPAASLAALAVPGAVIVAGAAGAGYHLEAPRLIAAAVAGVVALKTRSVPFVLVAGMATLWAAQALLG